jgi:hypothetical protein
MDTFPRGFVDVQKNQSQQQCGVQRFNEEIYMIPNTAGAKVAQALRVEKPWRRT